VLAELNKKKQCVAVEFNCLDLDSDSESRELEVEEKARMRELARELKKI
jgi:hypothetical protein